MSNMGRLYYSSDHKVPLSEQFVSATSDSQMNSTIVALWQTDRRLVNKGFCVVFKVTIIVRKRLIDSWMCHSVYIDLIKNFPAFIHKTNTNLTKQMKS